MEEIKNMLRSMQEEIKQQKVDILDMKEELKNTIINNMNEKFQGLELKTKLLEQQIESQKNIILSMEKNMKKKNLLFFGVEERERSYLDLVTTVLEIINKSLNIKCNESDIEFVRRLGKQGENIRPIVVTLCNMGLKINILKNKKRLSSSPYYIKEDFPLEVLKRRRELQTELIKEREAGNRAIIKYDKLVILGNYNRQKPNFLPNEHIGQDKNNKKRNSSTSPESLRSSKTNGNSSRNNKNNNMNNYLIKKPTLTFHGSLSQPTPDQDTNKSTQ